MNEDLLDRFRLRAVPEYRLYEPSSLAAVLGAAGKPELDLLLDKLEADGVPWLRRRGGGGTVILGPGQVVLALVTEVDSPFRNKEYFAQINTWISEALSLLGAADARPEGISDLAIDGRKILGSSIYRTRRILFYQASLLVSCDIALFTRYLAMPRKAPEYRKGRSHEDFCTTLAQEGHAVSPSEVIGALERVVSERLPRLR